MSLASSAPLQSGQAVQPNPVPTLAAPFNPVPSDDSTPRAGSDAGNDADEVAETGEKKHKKRGLFGFGKKKTSDSSSANIMDKPDLPPPHPSDQERPARRAAASPISTEHGYITPASPSRGAMASSPRLASPAGSQIFERDVQESAAALLPNSPAIPSHISTENHIPPVLDASSEAITDDHLDPDSVEIITHTLHQPASVAVSGALAHDSSSNLGASSWTDDLAVFSAENEDGASNYGSFDTTDVRRLSFISFADVVQSEQGTSHTGLGGAAGSRDSIHLAGLTSFTPTAGNRSPSPIRSPVSSQGGPGTSPPTSKSGSIKGLELSPSRKPLGSPMHSSSGHGNGEISIETMSQALRRTGSRDLSTVRSLPTSPIEGPSSR